MMRLLTLCAAALLLSGCSAGMKSDFTCEKIGGLEGCSSMTDIRAAMDRGEFTTEGQADSPPTPAPSADFIPLPRRDRFGTPQRTAEQLQKVTIFPFEIPEQKLYVDTTDVYIVLYDSTWTGRPVQAIRED